MADTSQTQPTPEHFLLTRFNLKIEFDCAKGQTEGRGLDPEWLARRFSLFDRYCVPSVARQTVSDFTWLVYFDPQTPEPFRSRIEQYRRIRQFVPVFLPKYDIELVRKSIRERLRPETTAVITSRVDNDDMIARRYLAEVRRALAGERFGFVNFPDGFQYAGGRLYPAYSRSNPFISLIEPRDELRTVLCVPHVEIAEQWQVKQIESTRTWLQVVHDGNVYNTVDFPDRRWPIALALRHYPILRRFLADRGYWCMPEELAFSAAWCMKQCVRRLPGLGPAMESS